MCLILVCVQWHLIFQVSAFHLHHFSEIADYSFTASMETEVKNFSIYIFMCAWSSKTLLKLADWWLQLWIKLIWESMKSAHPNGHWTASNCAHDYSCTQDISKIVIYNSGNDSGHNCHGLMVLCLATLAPGMPGMHRCQLDEMKLYGHIISSICLKYHNSIINLEWKQIKVYIRIMSFFAN